MSQKSTMKGRKEGRSLYSEMQLKGIEKENEEEGLKITRVKRLSYTTLENALILSSLRREC